MHDALNARLLDSRIDGTAFLCLLGNVDQIVSTSGSGYGRLVKLTALASRRSSLGLKFSLGLRPDFSSLQTAHRLPHRVDLRLLLARLV